MYKIIRYINKSKSKHIKFYINSDGKTRYKNNYKITNKKQIQTKGQSKVLPVSCKNHVKIKRY